MKKQIMPRAGTGIVIIMMAVLLCIPVAAKAGSLEPTVAPGSTMKTLDQIPPAWSQKLSAAQRFEIVLDGAGILDKETGLVWERTPEKIERTWNDAVTYCYQKTVGGRKGWRLPTVDELTSLVDSTQSNPSLPSGHPFLNVQSDVYWSDTSSASDAASAWYVSMYTGLVYNYAKSNLGYVWPVRGGN